MSPTYPNYITETIQLHDQPFRFAPTRFLLLSRALQVYSKNHQLQVVLIVKIFENIGNKLSVLIKYSASPGRKLTGLFNYLSFEIECASRLKADKKV